MVLSIGAAIYIAVKPLAKIFLNCSMGFILAKKNVLTVDTCQKISIIIVNFLIPGLIFYNVIVSLHGGEIKTIACIALSAFMFQAIGLLFGIIVRLTTPTPKKWLGGILCTGAFSNINDLPIAYVTTLAAGPYFSSGAASQGTAYSVIFLVCFVVTFFNMGSVRAIAMDFRPENDDLEKTIQEPVISLKTMRNVKRVLEHNRYLKKSEKAGREQQQQSTGLGNDDSNEMTNIRMEDERRIDIKQKNKMFMREADKAAELVSATGNVASTTQVFEPARRVISKPRAFSTTTRVSFVQQDSLAKGNSHSSRDAANEYAMNSHEQVFDDDSHSADFAPDKLSRIPTVADTEGTEFTRRTETLEDIVRSYSQIPTVMNTIESRVSRMPRSGAGGAAETSDESMKESMSQHSNKGFSSWCEQHHLTFVYRFVTDFQRPQSVALIISMTLTMIPWTRRLFVKNGINMPDAPDGLPALDFMMDFTKFIGNASVPLGLSMLGSTIARLEVKSLPKGFWKSTVLMSIFKLCVLPIIAVAWTNKMISMNWLEADNKMAIFVIVVTAAVPMSTVQLYMTALYTKPDSEHLEVDCVAVNMIVQYSMLVLTLTIVVTYVLKNMAGM